MHHAPAAHRATVVRRPVFSVRPLLASFAAVLVAVALALVATGGTYAYLASSQTVALVPGSGSTTATITAGSIGISTGGAAIALTGLYPGGAAKTADFTVTSTTAGAANPAQVLTVTAIAGPTAANGLVVQVAPGLCSAGGTPVGVGATSLGTVAPGATANLCLVVGMDIATPGAAAGVVTPTTITLTITGTAP